MKHYYFKQLQNNLGLKRLRDIEILSGSGKDFKKEADYKFGIYYSNDLTVDLSVEAVNQIEFDRSIYKSQVLLFAKIQIGYFIWFFDDKIYAFKCVRDQIEIDNENEPNYLKGHLICKMKTFQFFEEYQHTQLPLFFTSTSSNQAFNRNTIREFSSNYPSHKNVCDFLVESDKSKIEVDLDNLYDYLSPKQFESLIYMIFLYKKMIPDTYLAGSRKSIDLCVKKSLQDSCPSFFQIKKKSDVSKSFILKLGEKGIDTIHLGSEGEYGKAWIKSTISELIKESDSFKVIGIDTWIKSQFPAGIFALDL